MPGSHSKPLFTKSPIARCHCVPSRPSQGAIVCHVSHRKVPLSAYVAHCKEPSCAKFIMSRCHRVATLPIVWCLGRLSDGSPVCQVSHLKEPLCAYVPHVKVPSCAYVPHVKVPLCAPVTLWVFPLLCPKLSISWGASRVAREVMP